MKTKDKVEKKDKVIYEARIEADPITVDAVLAKARANPSFAIDLVTHAFADEVLKPLIVQAIRKLTFGF